MTIFTPERERVALALIEEVPLPAIFAAALRVMLHTGLIVEGQQGPDIKEKVAAWIETLNAEELLALRRIAEKLKLTPATEH